MFFRYIIFSGITRSSLKSESFKDALASETLPVTLLFAVNIGAYSTFLSYGLRLLFFCNQFAIFACTSCGEVAEII